MRILSRATTPSPGRNTRDWFTATHSGTKEEAIDAARQIVRELEKRTGNKCHELLMRGRNVKKVHERALPEHVGSSEETVGGFGTVSPKHF